MVRTSAAESPGQRRNSAAGVALRGPAAASDEYELLPHSHSLTVTIGFVKHFASPCGACLTSRATGPGSSTGRATLSG